MKTKMNKVQGDETMMMGTKTNVLPNVTLSATDLPEIKDWQVGKTYTIVMQVKMTKVQEGEDYPAYGQKPTKKIKARFDVTSVGVEEPEKEEYAQEYARKRSGA